MKSDRDITRHVLLQIIAEEENEGRPLFTREVLERLICMYGDSVQDAFRSHMVQSMSFFDRQTRYFLEHAGVSAEGNPMRALASLTRKNLDLWYEMQRKVFTAWAAVFSSGRQDQEDN